MLCVCHNIPLDKIAQAILQGDTLQNLQQNKICATKCKLCIPYINQLVSDHNKDKLTLNENCN